MKLTADIIGLLDLSPSQISKLRDRSRAIVLKRVGDLSEELVKMIHNDIKLVLSRGRTYYSNRKEGGKHIASAPGFPPNEDTGNLRRNVKQKMLPNGIIISSEARSKKGHPYAVDLETGTSHIEARPYFFTNVSEWEKKMQTATRKEHILLAVKNDLESQKRIKKELLK